MILQTWADRKSDRPVFISRSSCGELHRWSAQRLIAVVNDTANEIRRQGFLCDDRLVHSSGNGQLGVAIAIASLVAGTIEVPLDPALGDIQQDEFAAMVDGRRFDPSRLDSTLKNNRDLDSDTAIAIKNLRAIEAAADDSCLALILFTSGSTGRPRGVVLTRRNLFSNGAAKLAAAPQTTDDVRLTLLPLWHAYARTCDLMTWLLSGCTLAVGLGWNGWQQLAPVTSPTLLNVVPSLASRLLNDAESQSLVDGIRLLGCGGAAMNEAVFGAFAERGITVIQGYGLTEASPVVCSSSPWNARAGLVGPPVQGCCTRIDDDQILWVAGSGVMQGYWNDDQATAKKIQDGWLNTGDCVEVDSRDGQFRILGRRDERITLATGHKLYPGPLERLVAGCAHVKHALVVPNDRGIDLYIELNKQNDAPELVSAHLKRIWETLPAWQRPKRIEFVTAPFASIEGAVTLKGTLCRPVAILGLKTITR